MFLKRCPPTLGGLFNFRSQPKRSERNFLRENVLMLRGQHIAPTRMEMAVHHSRNPQLRAHNYELPTAASLARRNGPSSQALAEVQRRLMTLPPGRKRSERNRKSCTGMTSSLSSSSEKQIQTEDNWLHNPNQLEPSIMHRSEGDESSRPLSQLGHGLRRSASNFELGKMTEQRGNYQPGQYILHRPLGGIAGIVPGGLNTMDNWSENQRQRKPLTITIKRDEIQKNLPRVVEVAIPEITDANVEPEDLPSDRSMRSQFNSDLSKPSSPAFSPPPEMMQLNPGPKPELESQVQTQMEPQTMLLSDTQRVTLIELARTRQSQLITEYNRLPISMGTLRVRNLKLQLEQQLDVVEKDLSVLTQPKVYMKQVNSSNSQNIN